MNDLSPEARALLRDTRDAEHPSSHTLARIKQRVLVRAAVLGATTVAGGKAVAMSVTTKVLLVGLGIAMVGGGSLSWWAWKHHSAAPVAPAASSRPALVESPPTPAASDVISRPPAPPAADPHPRDNAKRTIQKVEPAAIATGAAARLPPDSTSSLDSLSPELAVLRQAQNDLRTGHPDVALQRLEEFDRQFSAGALGQERQAIAAIALCQARPGPAARARADRFLQTAPESPLAARVRSACER
jgi:hypothetical protein